MKEEIDYNDVYDEIVSIGINNILKESYINQKKNIYDKYDEADIVPVMYMIAIDDEDLNTLYKLNKRYQEFIESGDIDVINDIYQNNCLSDERVRKIISITNHNGYIKISNKFLFSLIDNHDNDLFKSIYTNITYTNKFIKMFLYFYKNYLKDKIIRCTSNKEFKNLLSKEMERIDSNEMESKGSYNYLMYACKTGNNNIAKFLIKNGADLNLIIDDLYSFLHTCTYEKVNIVQLIMEIEYEKNNPYSYHQIQVDVYEYEENLKVLIERGLDINNYNENGNTPLIEAIKEEDIELIKLFIENGADVNKKNKTKDTPLTIAFQIENEEIIHILVDKDADVNEEGNKNSPLILAVNQRNENIITYLFDHGAEANKEISNGDIALLKAIKNDNEVKETIPGKEPLNDDDGDDSNHSIIKEMMIEYRNKDIVTLLIEKGAKVNIVNKYGDTPLIEAIKKGYESLVEYLIIKGADVNNKNENSMINRDSPDIPSPLIVACRKGNFNIVQSLIVHGSYIHKMDSTGDTPLMNACIYGHETIVKLLVKYGEDINWEYNKGTPLIWACKKGKENFVQFLIKIGADVNRPDCHGNTPLIWACREGHENIVKLLIACGADVNKENKEGNVPLTYVCIYIFLYENIVKLLIENGANVKKPNKRGETPLLIAKKLGYEDDVNFMVQIRNPHVKKPKKKIINIYKRIKHD